jgi:hypothetical protein
MATDLVAAAAGDPSLAGRTRVLLTEAVEGGWGLAGAGGAGGRLTACAVRRGASRPARRLGRRAVCSHDTGIDCHVRPSPRRR